MSASTRSATGPSVPRPRLRRKSPHRARSDVFQSHDEERARARVSNHVEHAESAALLRDGRFARSSESQDEAAQRSSVQLAEVLDTLGDELVGYIALDALGEHFLSC